TWPQDLHSPYRISKLLFDSGTFPSPSRPLYHLSCPHPTAPPVSMGTPAAAAPLDIYLYCSLLQREVERLHDRLDCLEYGEAASTTPRGHHWCPTFDGERFRTTTATPAPTPAFIATTHTPVPLAGILPTAAGLPDRYSCTLVVPDLAVGHIVGRGGQGLHQHMTSPAPNYAHILIQLHLKFFELRIK
ncbi:hypothetical protein GGX14DRAFT_671806, partial [Mycena pura]